MTCFRSIGLLLAALLVGPGGIAAEATAPQAANPAKGYRDLKWSELVPADWDPTRAFKGSDAAPRSDADPRSQAMMQQLRDAWDAAPTVAALDNSRVRMPGYVVPLEESGGELREFLLVPYFGACIHTPPPPANQIVFVVAPKGVRFRAMDTVWVSGKLSAARQGSAMGTSGYRLEAAAVEPYVAPVRR